MILHLLLDLSTLSSSCPVVSVTCILVCDPEFDLCTAVEGECSRSKGRERFRRNYSKSELLETSLKVRSLRSMEAVVVVDHSSLSLTLECERRVKWEEREGTDRNHLAFRAVDLLKSPKLVIVREE